MRVERRCMRNCSIPGRWSKPRASMTRRRTLDTEADVIQRVQNGEQVELTDDEQQILSLDPDFAQRLQNAMKPQIDQESADRLGLSLDQYYEYAADVHNGMREQSAYQNSSCHKLVKRATCPSQITNLRNVARRMRRR